MSARTPGEIHAEIEDIRLRCYADLVTAPDERSECLIWAARYDRTAKLWREMHQIVLTDPDTPLWAVFAAAEAYSAQRGYADRWRDSARRYAELDTGGAR